MRTYYEVLGAPPWATHEELRVAYLSRAHELHPDLHHGAPAALLERLTDAMAELNDAWKVLSDETTRRTYDIRYMGVVRRYGSAPLFVQQQESRTATSRQAGSPGSRPETADRPVQWRTTPWRPDTPVGPAARADAFTAPGADSVHVPKMPRPQFNQGAPPGQAPPPFDSDSPTAVYGGVVEQVIVPMLERDRRDARGAVGTARPLAGGVDAALRSSGQTGGKRHWWPRRAGRRQLRCMYCGSTPAATVLLKGMRPRLFDVYYTPGQTVHGPVCGKCGLTLFRDLTDFALSCGGGGVGYLGLGVLMQWITAAVNASFWFKIRRLRSPERDESVRSMLGSPLDPGKSLLLRGGMVPVYVVLLVIGLVVAGAAVGLH